MLRAKLNTLFLAPTRVAGTIIGDSRTFIGERSFGGWYSTTDGINWEKISVNGKFRQQGDSNAIQGMYYNGDVYVVVTMRRIYASSDGLDWMEVLDTGATSFSMEPITWTGSQFVVIGTNGRTYFSSDGRVWTSTATITVMTNPAYLKYRSGFFFTVATDVLYYSRDALTWVSAGSTSVIHYEVSSEGNYLVSGGSAGVTLRTTWIDGATSLTFISGSASTQAVFKVHYSPYTKRFVIFQAAGNVRNSVDGAVWTLSASFTSSPSLNYVAMDPTGRYFITVTTAGKIGRSDNGGNSFTEVSLPVSLAADTPTHIRQGVFYVWNTAYHVMYTTDYGVTWNSLIGRNIDMIGGIATDGVATIVTGGDSGDLLTSKDGGATWVLVDGAAVGTTSTIYSIKHLKGAFYASSGGGKISRSIDGLSWTPLTTGLPGTNSNIYGMSGNDTYIVGVGANSIIISGTGTTWTTRTPPVASTVLRDVCTAKDNKFVTIGDAGNIWESTNQTGTTWVNISNSEFPHNLTVCASDGDLLVVGYMAQNSGVVLSTSIDNGRTWASHFWAGVKSAPLKLDWDGEKFVATTSEGYVFVSYDGYEWHDVFIHNISSIVGTALFEGKTLIADRGIIYEADLYEDKVLVKDGPNILTLDGDSWEPITYTGNPTETDYLGLGINNINDLAKKADHVKLTMEPSGSLGSGTVYRKTVDLSSIKGTVNKLGGWN